MSPPQWKTHLTVRYWPLLWQKIHTAWNNNLKVVCGATFKHKQQQKNDMNGPFLRMKRFPNTFQLNCWRARKVLHGVIYQRTVNRFNTRLYYSLLMLLSQTTAQHRATRFPKNSTSVRQELWHMHQGIPPSSHACGSSLNAAWGLILFQRRLSRCDLLPGRPSSLCALYKEKCLEMIYVNEGYEVDGEGWRNRGTEQSGGKDKRKADKRKKGRRCTWLGALRWRVNAQQATLRLPEGLAPNPLVSNNMCSNHTLSAALTLRLSLPFNLLRLSLSLSPDQCFPLH